LTAAAAAAAAAAETHNPLQGLIWTRGTVRTALNSEGPLPRNTKNDNYSYLHSIIHPGRWFRFLESFNFDISETFETKLRLILIMPFLSLSNVFRTTKSGFLTFSL